MTVPPTILPTLKWVMMSSQGSSEACFNPNAMRWFSWETSRTFASNSSPFRKISLGWRTTFVHERSETWIKPSTPFSNSTKAPNWVRFRTVPFSVDPTAYCSSTFSHGSGRSCLKPSAIFLSSVSIERICASTSSPNFTTSSGRWTPRVQDISDICTRPSTPVSSSTKAP